MFIQKKYFVFPGPEKIWANKSSWQFQPIWNNISKIGIFPQIGLKINKYVKPPPRNGPHRRTDSGRCLQKLVPKTSFDPLHLGRIIFGELDSIVKDVHRPSYIVYGCIHTYIIYIYIYMYTYLMQYSCVNVQSKKSKLIGLAVTEFRV